MKKFKFLKFSKTKKLRYMVNYFNQRIYLIFLPGFMSDIEGKKPQAIFKFAKNNKLGFLSLEYSGHGKSSGIFTRGNISIWSNESKKMIKKIVKKNNFILVGSSMGSWLSLILFKYFKKQIKGFVGIGSAPEFISRLMWKKFNKKIKYEIIKNKVCKIKIENYEYMISHQLIKDGKKNKNKVLNKKIKSNIYVTMIHGKKDEVVPVHYSKKVLNIFTQAEKKLKIVKKGDHSLSSNKNLKLIIKELNLIVKKIIN